MSDSGKAIFLSYASQDAEPARRICDALRAAGVEVWFDQSELRGGDAWDTKIRKQIKECALFIPIISANTQARREGYFRLEWKLADDRTHLMARGTPFIVPICIDETKDWDALVPDSFMTVQWTRLPAGATPPAFAERVRTLLSGTETDAGRAHLAQRSERAASSARSKISKARLAATGGAVVAIALALWQPWRNPERAPAAVAGKMASSPQQAESDQLVARAYALCTKMNYTRDNLAAAEDLTRRATELATDSAPAWAARAYVQASYLLRGWDTSEKRREDTQTFARRSLALDGNDVDAMIALSYLLNQQRGYAQSETLARRAVALRPDDWRVRSMLGAAIAGQSRHQEALELAQENVRLFPREPLTHYALANGQHRLGHLDAALAAYEAAIALQPFPGALMYKTILLISWRGDVAAARATLDQLAFEDRVEDRAVGVAMWLGLVERQPARVHAAAALTARTYFEDSVTPGPKAWSTAQAYRLERKESLARQHWQAAEAVLRQRLRDHPEVLDDQARLAITLVWLDRPDEAARLMAPYEAAAREQAGVESAYLLAQYYAALGDAAKAAPWLRQATGRRLMFVTPHALRLDPWWDKLRGQPAFDALLAEAAASPARDGPRAKSSGVVVATDPKSVAVLPFENLSSERDSEYFSDGISDELLNVLGRVPGLRVVARTSAFAFKGKNATTQEIGRTLNVAHLVEGSVQRMGTRARIFARLVRAETGERLWSERFDTDLKDIFAAQDEIAGLIAKNLSLTLGTARPAKTVNPAAHRLVLEGRHFWNLRSTEGFERAEKLFTQATHLEPQFAEAHAGLALVHVLRANNRLWDGFLDNADDVRLARTAAQRATELDAASAEAYAALGFALSLEGRLAEADQEFTRASQLSPNSAVIRLWHSLVLSMRGRLNAALEGSGKARDLDPLSAANLSIHGIDLVRARRFREAVKIGEHGIELHPDFIPHQCVLAAAYLGAGRTAEAVASARAILKYPQLKPRWHSDLIALWVLSQAGLGAEAATQAESLIAAFPPRSFMRGYILSAIGRFEDALPFLTDIPLMQARALFYEEIWDPWREDPRFIDLIAKMGRTEEYRTARAELASMIREQPPAGK